MLWSAWVTAAERKTNRRVDTDYCEPSRPTPNLSPVPKSKNSTEPVCCPRELQMSDVICLHHSGSVCLCMMMMMSLCFVCVCLQGFSAVLFALLPIVYLHRSSGMCYGLCWSHMDADFSQTGSGLHEREDAHEWVHFFKRHVLMCCGNLLVHACVMVAWISQWKAVRNFHHMRLWSWVKIWRRKRENCLILRVEREAWLNSGLMWQKSIKRFVYYCTSRFTQTQHCHWHDKACFMLLKFVDVKCKY